MRQLLGLVAFMMVGMVVQTLYSLIDIYWVGRLGAAAQAAVTLASNLMMVTMALSQMLAVGTRALVAQAVGRKDHEEAHHIFNQALGLALALSLLFAAAAWFGQGPYSRAFAADAQTADFALAYMAWFIPSMALQYPMMIMGSALGGTGNMKPGTVAQIASAILNMILAPLLIFGWLGLPRLGVAGAGLATFISVVASVIGLWLYFLRPQTYLRLRPGEWLPQAATIWRIVRIGLPSAMEFALMVCYMLFITAVLRPFGAAEQAAFGIGQRLLQAAMMPVFSISFAASAVAGQNYGARLGHRVRETFSASLKLGLACALPLFVVAEVFPAALVGAFSSEPAVLAGGTEFLRVIAFNLMAVSVAFASFGVLSGLGNTIPTLISSATRIALVVGPSWVLSYHAGFRPLWVWVISVAATVVQMLMNLYFLRRELHKRLGPAGPAVVMAAS
ncbi:MATE family efflux transporter [Nevskia soli]|uniref:MATE family efflux transporter n=1 Tax=Nevskia soli TaxID=418856 RepID=UPI0005661F62|nr:MATE family efflux transporter [Nevskia soli]